MSENPAGLPAPEAACPCCSGQAFGHCCAPCLAGQETATAEALMRSRYTAYALGLDAYVLRTWHPETRPRRLYAEGAIRPAFTRLSIIKVQAGGSGDREGWVAFEARFQTPDGAGVMRERSRFVRVEGQWRYVTGQPLPEGATAARIPVRNRLCPCGSGKKARHCCES